MSTNPDVSLALASGKDWIPACEEKKLHSPNQNKQEDKINRSTGCQECYLFKNKRAANSVISLFPMEICLFNSTSRQSLFKNHTFQNGLTVESYSFHHQISLKMLPKQNLLFKSILDKNMPGSQMSFFFCWRKVLITSVMIQRVISDLCLRAPGSIQVVPDSST